ncbi:MAG: peptidylprolyl isomerase [Burkholderiaceae bacterium]|jgi:peptidyl-prolyl cis-trans isomerase C|nr:peptidylprolyl isomerase [Burkholderiaceae bacterium]
MTSITRFIPRFLLFPLIAAISLPVFAQNAAVVNGKPVPASQVDAFVKEFVQQGQQDTPKLRAAVTESLIMNEVLVQEAEKKKMGAIPAVKMQMETMRRNILVRALMRDFVEKHPISDAEVKKEYDRMKAQMGDTEYKISHILVKTEDDAKALLAQLKDGAKFDELAKEKSIDAPTATRGGDLGWGAPHAYADPFAQALARLKKGEYSQAPIQSARGYHIIMVEDTRQLKFPSLEDLKPAITQELQDQLWNTYAKALRVKARVK